MAYAHFDPAAGQEAARRGIAPGGREALIAQRAARRVLQGRPGRTVAAAAAGSAATQPQWPDAELTSLAASMRHVAPSTLAEAAAQIRPWASAEELALDVSHFVRRHVAAARGAGRQAIVLVGELQTLQSCLMVEMAAMRALHREHGPGAVLMLQQTPAALREFARASLARLQAWMPKAPDGAQAEAFDRRLAASLAAAPDHARASWLAALKVHAASRLGCAVTGFDTRADAPHPATREVAMARAVQLQARTACAPVIVAVARRHLPVLRDLLARDAGHHVAALAVADDSIFHDGQCSAELARSSYVVSHCAVKAFRVADRIEHGPMHYLRFAARLGIGLRMPAPQ